MQHIALKGAHSSPTNLPVVNQLSHSVSSRKYIQLASIALCLTLSLSFGTDALANQRDVYKRIYDRLAGVPPTPAVMKEMVTDTTVEKAAEKAMENPNFYNVTLKNFATPWTNEAQSVFEPLNDYSATIIGMIRDNKDFRQILSGNIIYIGSLTPAYANDSNQHYVEIEKQNIDLSDPAKLFERTQTEITGLSAEATAGVMTTRAASRAFFVDGTNRAMFRFTLLNHLCYDLEQLKDNTRTADRIRQDVSRSPGGDSRLFFANCLACHAGMDPMAQAFAYYEWDYKDNNPNTEDDPDSGRLVYTPGTVQPKYHINATNFKGGYITPDDSWSNYWRRGPNAWLGWADNATPAVKNGKGAKSLGEELANSDAFARCQVKKVFKTVCLRSPDDRSGESTEFNSMVSAFKSDYNMKNVFSRAAIYCSQ